MKILLVTLEYPPQIGGIGSYTYNQVKYWPHKIDQFFVYAPQALGSEKFDKQNDWLVLRKKPFFKYIWPHWLRIMWQILVIIKKEKIEMIYVHHVLPVGYVIYLINKFIKIPYAVFLHGLDFGYALKTKGKAKKLAKVCRAAEKIVVNSNYLKDKVVNKFSDLSEKIFVVYPCPSLDDTEIKANKLEQLVQKLNPDKRPLILTCSRLVKRKGHDMVIKSLLKVIKRIPNILYLIVGRGEYKEKLEDLVKQNNLTNNVKFIEFVSQANLPYLYNLADVFIMPARELSNLDVEGFGIVFLESNLMSKPVIGGRSGGMPEAIKDGYSGILVDPENIERISQAIIKLLSDKELANQLGRQGKERTLSEFKWEKQLSKI